MKAQILRRPLRLSLQLSLSRIPEFRRTIMTSVKIALPSGKEYVQPTGLFINNQFVKAKSGLSFDAINPATSKVICQVEEASAEDVDIAVAAARAALDGEWGELTPTERGKLLIKFAELIEEDAETLAAIEALNGGKVPCCSNCTNNSPIRSLNETTFQKQQALFDITAVGRIKSTVKWLTPDLVA
jgi:Aldehyde dehydrogenase family